MTTDSGIWVPACAGTTTIEQLRSGGRFAPGQPLGNLRRGKRAASECGRDTGMRGIGDVTRRKRPAARCLHVAVNDEVPARVGGGCKLGKPGVIGVRPIAE